MRTHQTDQTVRSSTLFNRRCETTATCFDCCLSQEIRDGVNGWLTTKLEGFDLRKAIDPVPELDSPEVVERPAKRCS